ncbi:MAG TPA: serine hydrolase domain-containing protein [Terracidiphilus sp.]|nr:serine hydrolase domain-containing protein [Terracidiphilus sp.]
MRFHRPLHSAILFCGLLAIALGSTCSVAQELHAKPPSAQHTIDLTQVKPETVGFSSERLERLHTLMQQAVQDQQVAGVVTILARHGKVIDYGTYGMRDIASHTAMSKDTIFRDYSMTKPVTAVAMLILYEEGKWLPSDPISKYIPEFAHLKVYAGAGADGKPNLVDPDHPPTMAELMTHTAGFTYGLFGDTAVDHMYRDAHLFESKDLHEFVSRLGQIPLLYQPGTKWVYSVSMDIQGYIVEKLSGVSLPDFMRTHIFTPLGMKDAGFYVPQDKWSRFATVYWVDPKGGLSTSGPGVVNRRDFAKEPGMPSGGGGLVSTAEDYFRFAEMLAHDGELNGARILSPASVRLMSSNHLTSNLLTGQFRIGYQVMRPGFGYGYNCAVVFDPPMANLPEGKGTFFWDGAAGTWFWIDPTNDIVFVGMIQRMNAGPASENLQYLSRSVVYGALVDPSK